MRKLPTVLAFAFIAITLWRVGQFAQARMYGGWVGWLFSIVLGAGVFVSAYFTRSAITKDTGEDARSKAARDIAMMCLVICVAADGLFNLAETWLTVQPADTLLIVATVIYGTLPTIAAAIFGMLQGRIDRLPLPPAKVSVWLTFRKALVAAIERKASAAETKQEPAAKLPAKRKRKDNRNDWRSLPEEDRSLIAGMKTAAIVQRYGVSERTARNWKQAKG